MTGILGTTYPEGAIMSFYLGITSEEGKPVRSTFRGEEKVMRGEATAVAVSPECSVDYIRLSDYARPMIGGAFYGGAFGCLFGLMVTLQGCPFGLASTAIVALAMAEALAFALVAWAHHQLWLYRLRKYGPSAFEQFVNLEMPKSHAFELCLAATCTIERSHIESLDDERGTIRLRAKGNVWTHVDRSVDISVASLSEQQTRLKITSAISLSRLRTKLFELVWGRKWCPIVFRTDYSRNRKLIERIVTFIHSVPNWDHCYIPLTVKSELTPRAIPQNKDLG